MNSATGRSRFCGVSPVEFFDEAASWDVREGFPRIIGFGVTFPFNQILEPVFDAAGIPNILDFEVIVIVFDIKGRRSRSKAVRGGRY